VVGQQQDLTFVYRLGYGNCTRSVAWSRTCSQLHRREPGGRKTKTRGGGSRLRLAMKYACYAPPRPRLLETTNSSWRLALRTGMQKPATTRQPPTHAVQFGSSYDLRVVEYSMQ
jgi:hypothetical protein